jgi:hypothetical protein
MKLHASPVWLLLGISASMGPSYFARDTAKDADIRTPEQGSLPSFSSLSECQRALQRAIAKYSGKSHAAGNYGLYACVDINTWTSGE